jgi:hypothetical protein
MKSMTRDDTLLLGRGRLLERVPAEDWQRNLVAIPGGMAPRLAFMTADHRTVRNAAVLHLPRNQRRPLSIRQLSRTCALPESRVDQVLIELQKNLFFLVRNRRGGVVWAFPITVERTPHHLTFSSGERLWGA